MVLAVASGKGGTGKTTVAVALAKALAGLGPVSLVDLDVEAPNAHLFLNVEWQSEQEAYLPVPEVDKDKCNLCGECSDICQFKAISLLGEHLLTFEQMCHGCGACWEICPQKAISVGKRELGLVSHGSADGGRIEMTRGLLRVGEALSPPLMKQVCKGLPQDRPVIIDAPPGTSCPAMTATSYADAMLLVTEPTPFGLYDLKLAVASLALHGKPMAVVINRSGDTDPMVDEYCQEAQLPVVLRIPYSPDIAKAYSRGEGLLDTMPQLAEPLLKAYQDLMDRAQNPLAKEARQ